MREGIVTMLGVRDDFVVVAQVGDGARPCAEAHAHPARRRDAGHPDAGARRHRGDPPDRRGAAGTKVLVLTTFGTDDLVFAALAAGAGGFLLKDVRAEDLLEAVAAVARGEGRLDPAVTAAVVGHFRDHRPVALGRLARSSASLTDRETRGAAPPGRGHEQRRDRRSTAAWLPEP